MSFDPRQKLDRSDRPAFTEEGDLVIGPFKDAPPIGTRVLVAGFAYRVVDYTMYEGVLKWAVLRLTK